ncbi:MAG: nitroreductase/quinone reductase family protein [Mycobacterium sp.]|uniref:nitroreductase/quinone reductase family protein n=1 Tax=Mycobacterium sp. TaxID=1785 RepID=UPI003C56420C
MSNPRNFLRLIMRAAPLFNAPVTAIASSPRLGTRLRRSITLITYTGRRSGRTFTIPVAYRRRGDEIDITPNLPDAKTWWRNFLGDGAPISLTLNGVERGGHAVAHRDDNGRVTVRVRLAEST